MPTTGLMTRRLFAALPAALLSSSIRIPIHRIVDAKARFMPGALEHFWSAIWPEAVRDFARGGIELQTSDGPGEITHTAADRALFSGLQAGSLNLVLTDTLPLYWDNARALAGATTLVRGYCVSVIALRYAHGDRAPFLSVNTCVHEILHALLLDIFVARPSAYQSIEREYRVDSYATRMWLFHDGAAIRQSARIFVERLASPPMVHQRLP